MFAAALIMLSVSGCATDQTSKQTSPDAEETTEVAEEKKEETKKVSCEKVG